MNNRGFTLIEILVAIGVLLILLIMGTGGLVQVIQAHRETQAMQNTMNDLNYVMESMSRHIRFGKDYRCRDYMTRTYTIEDYGDISLSECVHIYTLFEGLEEIEYRLVEVDGKGVIERKIEGQGWEEITSSDSLDVTRLVFTLSGQTSSDGQHPRVTMRIEGAVSVGGGEDRDFGLQTTVNQRFNE